MERWESQLQKELDLLSTYLSHIQHDRNINIIITRYHAIRKRIQSLKESYQIELQLIKDKNRRNEYENKLKLYNKKIENITAKIDKVIEIKTRNINSRISDIDLEFQSTNIDLLSEAKTIQNETQYSIVRSTDLIDHSTMIATTTIQTLHQQGEQIRTIGSEVKKIESNMDKASKFVREYAYYIASDRIFQFFSVLNSLLFIVILIYAFSTGKKVF